MIFECEYLKESTAVPDKNHKYPVYVVLMNGKSPLSKIILKVTGDYFSHSCIAFNSKLDPLYSFATKSEKQGGGMGFSISKPQDRSCFGKQAYYSVYVTYVTAEEIKKMKEVMDKFISKEKDLRYDFTGLVRFALNKDSETHTDYFCSRFVAEVLSVGVKLDKAASLYKPQDFATFKEFTLINRGFDFVNYDHKITERNEKLLKEGKFNPDEVFFESAATQIVKDEKGDYKEQLKLSAFTKVTLTDAITRVYSRKVSSLERITINNKTKGFIWLDNSNDCVVAVANVIEKDDGTKWIQTFEIFHPYQGKGLSKQILDVVIRELQGQYISVQKSSDVAIKVLKSKGFNQFKSGENNIFMSRDNSTEEDIDESAIEIEGENGFFDKHNRWNPIVKINGEQYRYRVECLVIRGTRIFLSKNPQTGEFIIPGGGVDKILSNEEQVAKECQEEARMVITNIENTGVVYVNRRGVSEKGKKLPVEEQWVGAYNEIYIADYVGHYRGAVEKVDQDPAMMKGRFVEIEQVYEKLRPEWQEALSIRFDIEVVEESVKFYKNPRIALKRKNTIKKNSNIQVGKNDDVGLSTPDNSVKKESGKVPNTDIGKAAEDARKLLTKEIFACKDGAAAYDNLMCPKDNGFAIINWNLSKLKHDSDKANFPKYRDAVFDYCKRQFDQTHPNYELLCDNLTQCFWIRPIQ